jgi:glycine/D-amino acid oxidase-like deaminating enzyme
MTRAVFFDVDFTLIHPGPMFRGEGYGAFRARYRMTLHPAKFAQGVASAARQRGGPEDTPCHAGISVAHTRISSST